MTPEEIEAARIEAERLAALENDPPAKTAAEIKAEIEAARIAQEVRDNARHVPTDEEAKLLKEVMKWKTKAQEAETRAKLYDGIDPAKAKAALDAQVEAERKGMEARGEYDRIIAQVAAEADVKVSAADARANAAEARLSEVEKAIADRDVDNQFANSPFIRDKLVISGQKVRTLYGDHFDTVDGTLVAYDKPRGAKERTPLVDGSGKNLSFEAAIEKIVKADSDSERLIKSTVRQGAGSHTSNLIPPVRETPKTGTAKILAGIEAIKKPGLKLRP